MPRIRLVGVAKSYPGPSPVHALRGIDLTIEQGELIAIEGPSGAGKSTLLNMLALLDLPTSGKILVGLDDPSAMRPRALAKLRSRTFGFIFQGFHLLDAHTVIENVTLAFRYRALPRARQLELAAAALEQVGLADRAEELARNLSGGQRQRVAIARAIAGGAPVLVADEPTGNLDSENSAAIIDLLTSIARTGRTVVIVTHSADVAAAADRRIVVRDGRIASDARVAGAPALAAEDEPTEVLSLASDGGEPSAHAAAARQEGHDSRLSLPDLLRDAWGTLASRPGKYAALVLVIALGVGLAVTTFGLTEAARAQVAQTFDATRNIQVDAALGDPRTSISEYAARSEQLAGVDLAGAVHITRSPAISAESGEAPAGTPLAAVTPDYLESVGATVRWQGQKREIADGEVLVGGSLAAELGLPPLFSGPRVRVNGTEAQVVGIIEESALAPELLRSVVGGASFPVADSPLLPPPVTAVPPEMAVHVRAVPGAAQQIAQQLPLALQPEDPSSVHVQAPPDPQTQRGSIEATVRASLLALSAVSILVAVISLMNSMSVSVLERSRELGLRRALGAQRSHLRRLVMVEAMLLGAAGGVCGLFLGLLAVLSVSISRGWVPIFDPVLAPIAVAAGIVVAALAGAVAAWRASRIQPVEALRL